MSLYTNDGSPEYQRWVEDMAQHCLCQPPHDCPCAGVLAGGLCDRMGVERDTADYSETKQEPDEDDEL